MKSLLLVLSLALVAGCSSKKQKEIRDEVAQEKNVDGKSLGMTISDQINNSATLTDAQKKELTGILSVNKATAEALNEESFKFRSVLIKTLLSGNVDKKKVELIKKDIKKIEAKKLKNTFDTVEKITRIVSKETDARRFEDGLIMIDRYSR